jgi:peptide/nickel transport system ATP-binding protein
MNPVVEVKGLKKHYPIKKGLFGGVAGYVKAVDDVSFTIYEGETFGLVGESGCGKTTAGKTLLRALDPTAGEVRFHVEGKAYDLASLREEELRELRRHMQMIFQDPFSSLNPRMTVLELIGEPLMVNGLMKGKALRLHVEELLERVGLDRRYVNRYPHAFSGGQRQRIGVARAIATNPRFIVADEPVSALDVSIQAQILNLLEDIQQEFGLSYLFVAHDLSVVQHICDRVAVMYVGKIAELADTDELFFRPAHPYTEALLSSVPPVDPDVTLDRAPLEGEVPDAANPPSGCYFHTRCPYAKEICSQKTPELRPVRGNEKHLAACHFADELDLNGVSEMEVPDRFELPEAIALERNRQSSETPDGSAQGR